jgi:hypothetical protein
MLKRTSSAGYVYDEKSGAILNTNTGELEQYLAARAKAQQDRELVERVERLERLVIDLQTKLDGRDG